MFTCIFLCVADQSPEKADAFVKSHLIPDLTKSEIEELVKLQHPKFILQSISDKLEQLFVRTRFVWPAWAVPKNGMGTRGWGYKDASLGTWDLRMQDVM